MQVGKLLLSAIVAGFMVMALVMAAGAFIGAVEAGRAGSTGEAVGFGALGLGFLGGVAYMGHVLLRLWRPSTAQSRVTVVAGTLFTNLVVRRVAALLFLATGVSAVATGELANGLLGLLTIVWAMDILWSKPVR